MLGVKIVSVEQTSAGNKYCAPWSTYVVTVEKDGEVHRLECEAVLNATGRAPNVANIGLETVRSYLFSNLRCEMMRCDTL